MALHIETEANSLTPQDAAVSAGVSERTIRRYIASGVLPAYRLAGRRLLRIRRADLDGLLERVPSMPGGDA